MDVETLFTREDMTFAEAVQYFGGRVPVTADEFYAIAEEYRGLA
ncbi:phage head morphogenesis protein, partial [Clostridiaceae bacterium]|nr:phage head morphogenesis protein [Clostridiaceae bacterium]